MIVVILRKLDKYIKDERSIKHNSLLYSWQAEDRIGYVDVFFDIHIFYVFFFFFFFQAEDGIRDTSVTGVQTCALPIFGMDLGCYKTSVAATNGTRETVYSI